MLKRQRPTSPPPSIPDIALLPSDPSTPDLSHHAMKRRRVFAPSLDGPSRGWGPPVDASDDGEEYLDEDADMDAHHHDHHDQESQPMEGTAEYKAVNSLLHDLHAEHQYRRVLASPSNSTLPFHTERLSSPASLFPPTHAPHASLPFGKDVQMPHPQPPFRLGYAASAKDIHLDSFASLEPGVTIDESLRVQERYESSNRLLRAAFLDRRRHLPESGA
ncbi:hypothetical protein BV25DRAFT_1987532 [Artomyces pyxidatus]|uniref:Uncharacterized protein n=1 Tax=Artomyces pyxidatus TaxID=48021 RepID=A0ACB8THK8_9AGAM|nr:hypothetical protein BV25DRAFT_1987532 [Artomyces pyxidatus]